MSFKSETKWSDKHHRYFQHVVADDGSILETVWLESADRIEAEDEATEQSTIPTNPEGDPRRSGNNKVEYSESNNPYAPKQPSASGSGMYLPTQPDYEPLAQSEICEDKRGIATFGGEVVPLHPRDLPPVEPPPPFPLVPVQIGGSSTALAPQRESQAVAQDHYDYVWHSDHGRYHCLYWNYTAARWLHYGWMPQEWRKEPIAHEPEQGALSIRAAPVYTSPSSFAPTASFAPSTAEVLSASPQTAHAHVQPLSSNYGTFVTHGSPFEGITAPAYHPASTPSSLYTPITTRQVTPDVATANISSMPKGKGLAFRGTYSGPSTLHHEEIDQSYYVRDKSFFSMGRVFSIILAESATVAPFKKHDLADYSSSSSGGTNYSTSSSNASEARFNNNFVYMTARRFVVVRQRREFCYACPIFTYSGKATTKQGVVAAEHSIAYSWGQQPQLLSGEGGITKPSLTVVMSQGVPVLDKASRIYYGIQHPIQYNVKVKEIGYVPESQVPVLIGSWKEEDKKDTEQAAYITRDADIPEKENSGEEVRS